MVVVLHNPKMKLPERHRVCFDDEDVVQYSTEWITAGCETAKWLVKQGKRKRLTLAKQFFQLLLTEHQPANLDEYNRIVLKTFHDMGYLRFLKSNKLPQTHLRKKKYLIAFKDLKGNLLFTKQLSSLREIQQLTGVYLKEIKITSIDITNAEKNWFTKSGLQLRGETIKNQHPHPKHNEIHKHT